MAIEIREIKHTSKSDLKKFVRFPIKMYEGNTCYVPALVFDEIDTLRPQSNPAFDFCEAKYFMAFDDGKPVGRIAGIINKVVNEKYNEKSARFGFIDFVDNREVSAALMKAVEDWAREKGMDTLRGPLGFTDMDPEGLLVEGFDEEGTMATIYNHPYYVDHIESMGFEKEADWVEFRIAVPDEIPDKMRRISDIIRTKYKLRNLKYTSTGPIVKNFGHAIFDLVNEAYGQFYGFSQLTPKQIDHYLKMYVPVLRPGDVSLIVDENDTLVGFGAAIPSLSKALIRSRGELFPLGWFHLLKALKAQNDVVDLMLVAVKPEYQSKGVNALLFTDLIPCFKKEGYKFAETNPELEENQKVQSQWGYFDTRQHKRRRAYSKKL